MEFLFEFLGEFLLQALGEVLLELRFRSMAEPFRRRPNPWLASVGDVLIGAILGGLSLLVFPRLLVAARLRTANLFVTPVVSGALLGLFGLWRRRDDDVTPPFDRFVDGFLFALAFAVVRFFFAK